MILGMQKSLFDLDDTAFAIKKQTPQAVIDYTWRKYFICSVAQSIMLNPLNYNVFNLEGEGKEYLQEYIDEVIDLMSNHSNKEIMILYFQYAEQLVEYGHFVRYVCKRKIKYQNPRSFSGNYLKATITIVSYDHPNSTVHSDMEYERVMLMLCGVRLEGSNYSQNWSVSNNPIHKDVFTHVSRQLKAISPSILKGRGRLYP